MDFSAIPSLETILGYTVGGVSVGAILVAVYKIIKWLKKNSLEKAVKLVTDAIVGKDINVDLSILAEKRITEMENRIISIVSKQQEQIQQNNIVTADMADIISTSRLASEEQRKALQEHTEPIRVYGKAKPKEVIKVKLEPVKVTETKNYIPEAL